MAKEKLNQIKKPKKPLRQVLFQSLKKLIYLLLVLSIAGLIYLINNSKLFLNNVNFILLKNNIKSDKGFLFK